MLRTCKLVLAAVLASIVLSACATEQGQETVEGTELAGPIQSAADLETYLRTTSSSPLDRLSAAARQRFLDSLVFSKNGLGSYQYTELEALTATEAHDILSLFGAERTTSLITGARITTESDKAVMQAAPGVRADHEGYWCSSPSTCTKLSNNICMSSC